MRNAQLFPGRDVPFSALYLASYEMLKQEIPSKIDASPNTCHVLAGLGKPYYTSLISTITRKPEHDDTVNNCGETIRLSEYVDIVRN